jgi:hypothetical protein
VKAIMCENTILCDYPVDEKETKAWLKGAMKQIQEVFKNRAGAEQEWVDSVCNRILEGEIPKKMCFVCAIRFFMSVLVFKKKETLDPFILEWVLVLFLKLQLFNTQKRSLLIHVKS